MSNATFIVTKRVVMFLIWKKQTNKTKLLIAFVHEAFVVQKWFKQKNV